MKEEMKQDHTVLVMILIVMCMIVIIFCCYLIYRQNLIIKKDSENHLLKENATPNVLEKRKYDQVIFGNGNTVIKEVLLSPKGRTCITYQKEENQTCMDFKNPVYMDLYETKDQAYLYLLLEDGSVTEVFFTSNFDVRIKNQYRNLKNIVRMYQTNDPLKTMIFVDYNGNEF